MGADGHPEPARPPARPRLCEAGPCRRYHKFTIQVDAAAPRAVRLPILLPEGTPRTQPVPGGTVYSAPAGFFVQTHHYCYPDTGIEMPLGDLPVTECNRWEPHGGQDRFLRAPDGQEYLRRVAEWEGARLEEAHAAAEIQRAIDESLAMAEGDK